MYARLCVPSVIERYCIGQRKIICERFEWTGSECTHILLLHIISMDRVGLYWERIKWLLSTDDYEFSIVKVLHLFRHWCNKYVTDICFHTHMHIFPVYSAIYSTMDCIMWYSIAVNSIEAARVFSACHTSMARLQSVFPPERERDVVFMPLLFCIISFIDNSFIKRISIFMRTKRIFTFALIAGKRGRARIEKGKSSEFVLHVKMLQ